MAVYLLCRYVFTKRHYDALMYEVIRKRKAFEFKLLIYKAVAAYLFFTISLESNFLIIILIYIISLSLFGNESLIISANYTILIISDKDLK